MNKFGIFNLLNSFFSPSSTISPTSSSENNQNLNFLSNLFSQNTPSPPPPVPEKEKGAPIQPAPLQQGMLFTMKSHDDFVKRVKSQNP